VSKCFVSGVREAYDSRTEGSNWKLRYKYLRILPCDVMLGSHTPFYHMQEKYAKIGKGSNPFIGGQQGCLADIDGWEQAFNKRLAADQKKVSASVAQ
jgi:hypothetical protein